MASLKAKKTNKKKKKTEWVMPTLSTCRSPPAKAPNSCHDLHDLVTIRVTQGSQIREFLVIRPLLRWHSSYFRVALDPNGHFKESGAKVVEVEDDINAFASMLCWINTGSLDDIAVDAADVTDVNDGGDEYSGDNNDNENEGGNSEKDEEGLMSLLLYKVWVLADKRGLPGLADATIDKLHERLVSIWSLDTRSIVPYTVRNTNPESCLWNFLHDMLMRTKSSAGIAYHVDVHLHDFESSSFLMSILKLKLDRDGNEEWQNLSRLEWAREDRCQWHQH
ncbi:unnamed protein product [Periconia digitata]|uniref:BTB domain-containing protein n=1 Tax=Periconia digitata TaxID=1303443 RepID=A0A9W4XGN8_9PLEO|nr:unnamed protein product [Periconia digitata]